MALRFPLDNVNITQGWGADPAFYRQYGQQGHNGIDLGAPAGTPVYAAEAGTVVYEGWGGKNGWVGKEAGIHVLIRHAGLVTNYAHLSGTVINSGQSVAKGQHIGYVGATGVAYGAHLHFEAFPLTPNFDNGFAGRIDPMPYISTVKTATADQIRQAYNEILERPADAAGLTHYANYTIEFTRDDLARSQEKRELDARKAEAARVAAAQAQAEAARRAEEATRAAEAQKALEAAQKAEAERLAAEAELARVAEEERIARAAAEAKAKAQLELAEKAAAEQAEAERKLKEEAMATTAAQIDQIQEATSEVLNSNEFTPVINDHVKTVAYFVTDSVAIASALAFTILAILGSLDGVVAITISTAIATAMLGLKQTFRLSAKKQ